MAKKIRCYDYVNQPYERVRDALRGDALALFRGATKVASSRVREVASELRVNLAGIEVAKDIAISVEDVEELPSKGRTPPSLRLGLEWEAARSPRLFPIMRAVLSAYPLTSTETQLDLAGEYEPPLGALGTAVNAVMLHRIAEASVHRFLQDVAAHLRTSLARSSKA